MKNNDAAHSERANQADARREALLVLILAFGVFGIINTEMGVVGILPQIAERFGVSISEAGLTVSVFALVVSLCAPVLPLLMAGVNRRRMMIAALGLFAASNIISLTTDSFAVLLAARTLPALLHPVYVAAAFTVAAQVAGDSPSRGVSRVFVGVSAGMVLGVPMTNFITAHFSYEAAMALFAFVNLSVMAATLAFVPKDLPVQKKSVGEQVRLLKRPALILSVVAFMCINGAMFGFFSFMSEYLSRVTGLDTDAVSAVLLAYGLANIVGNMAAGRWFGRMKRLSTTAGPAVMLAAYALLYLAGARESAAWVILIALGIMAGYINIAGQYMISTAARGAPDFANGLFLAAANFGTAFGTFLDGCFIAAANVRASLAGTILLLAAAFVFVRLRVKREVHFEYREREQGIETGA